MRQVYQKRDKILKVFFEESERRFTIREISKITKIPHASVQRCVKQLQEEQLITEDHKANITSYFTFKKALFLTDTLFTSGLIDYLKEQLRPSVIILFGSVRKGEYDKESDIDLFIETHEDKNILQLQEFEKRLGHKIQLFTEKDIRKLPPELLNNIINGIKLQGYFQIT